MSPGDVLQYLSKAAFSLGSLTKNSPDSHYGHKDLDMVLMGTGSFQQKR